MFTDYVKIYAIAGKGGDGAISFRREKYVAAGGPDGGDGGKGGNVVFAVDPDANTLIEFRFKKKFKANPGSNGSGAKKTGRTADNLIIKVPIGTVVKDAQTNEVLADLSNPGQEEIILRGGRGGLGNSHFATSTRQAPRFAQDGEPGEERELVLELKMLADVGLLGFPNAGKSTLLSVTTAARPKIANYEFTTLEPNVDVVTLDNGSSFVMADIPGLIEGASEGTGLGIRFLRHVERTRVLLHMIDVSGTNDRNPREAFEVINNELKKYSDYLAKREQILVGTKIDAKIDDEGINELKKIAKENNLKVFFISSVANEGVKELMDYVSKRLTEIPKTDLVQYEITDQVKVYRLDEEKEKFTIRKEDGVFVVEGEEVDAILRRVNIGDNESLFYLHKKLSEIGLNTALRKMHISEGDIVKIGGYEMEWED